MNNTEHDAFLNAWASAFPKKLTPAARDAAAIVEREENRARRARARAEKARRVFLDEVNRIRCAEIFDNDGAAINDEKQKSIEREFFNAVHALDTKNAAGFDRLESATAAVAHLNEVRGRGTKPETDHPRGPMTLDTFSYRIGQALETANTSGAHTVTVYATTENTPDAAVTFRRFGTETTPDGDPVSWRPHYRLNKDGVYQKIKRSWVVLSADLSAIGKAGIKRAGFTYCRSARGWWI